MYSLHGACISEHGARRRSSRTNERQSEQIAGFDKGCVLRIKDVASHLRPVKVRTTTELLRRPAEDSNWVLASAAPAPCALTQRAWGLELPPVEPRAISIRVRRMSAK